MTEPFDAGSLAVLERQIDEWIGELASAHDHIAAVDRAEDDVVRWFVRMRGEEKDFTTAWITLGQRTLRYETYVMPAPEENAQELWEHLLRRNDKLTGVHFSIGAEDAVYLRGSLPVSAIDKDVVDQLLGTLYATVEQCFAGLLAIGFASRFRAAGGDT